MQKVLMIPALRRIYLFIERILCIWGQTVIISISPSDFLSNKLKSYENKRYALRFKMNMFFHYLRSSFIFLYNVTKYEFLRIVPGGQEKMIND